MHRRNPSFQLQKVKENIFTVVCKKLRRNPSFLWHIDRNKLPVRHFFSTESLDSGNEDRGKGMVSSLTNSSNPSSTTETLLRRYGFKDTHLSKLHTLRPHYFTSVTVHKLLLPKLEFYRRLGLSNTDLPKIVCSNAGMLDCSLEDQIVPWYSFIKKLLLLYPDGDEGVVNIMKRCPRLITTSMEKTIAPNVAALRQAGVPHSRISHLLRTYPAALSHSSLPEYIKEVTEMGFNPNKSTFVDAVKVFGCTSKSTRDMKMEVYRKCGMTDAHILMAFRLHPICMALSKGNIEQTMDFVVKKMGWQPVDVAKYPVLLSYSLEKRTIPRCTVVRYLQGKGLLKKTISLGTFFNIKEEDFMDRFVKKHEDDVPGLMDIYLASKIIPPRQEQILQSETAGLVGSLLENHIVPWYKFIKDLLSSDYDEEEEEEEAVLKIMKRNPRLITRGIEKTIAPNVAALRQAGVPHSKILHLLRIFPATLGYASLLECIKEATEMGFDPNKTAFVGAVRVFVSMSKSTRDMKMEVLRKCGMTDAQILMAFRLQPNCMALSKGNIEQTMDFVVKKMGWQPVDVAKHPALLTYSLEKRIIPRCTVVRYLQGKGLLNKTISLATFFKMKEEDFMDKFVKKYEDDVPGLMDIYLASKITPPQEQILQSEPAGLVGNQDLDYFWLVWQLFKKVSGLLC